MMLRAIYKFSPASPDSGPGLERLTDSQWEHIRRAWVEHVPASRSRRRASDRQCFGGILWLLWAGAAWSELPAEFGSPSTCWRRLKAWSEQGVLVILWRAYLAELDDQAQVAWDVRLARWDAELAPTRHAYPGQNVERFGKEWLWSLSRALRWELIAVRRDSPE